MCSLSSSASHQRASRYRVPAMRFPAAGSRHYIPPNLDIKVTFKVIQDSVLGVVNYCYTIIVS